MKTNRREFLLLTTVSPIVLSSLIKAQSVSNDSLLPVNPLPSEIKLQDLAPVPEFLENQFSQLIDWLKQTGWSDFFLRNFDINLRAKNEELKSEFIKSIDSPITRSGFGDFGGKRFIEPGDPAMSLLYYALASANVKPPELKNKAINYPCLNQIDIVENYIYSLKKIDLQKINNSEKYSLAVFSYEFREARKTPHEKHADLVYSRTGISRVGDEPANYDYVNRCFTNKPINPASEKNIAVTPARYGLFLAEKLNWNQLALMTQDDKDNDKKREFLLPIRKVFSGDSIIGGATFAYTENHRNEKLFRLVTDGINVEKKQNAKIEFENDLFCIKEPPFQRISFTNSSGKKLTNHNSDIVELSNTGSSAILTSIPASLIREAYQGNKRIRIKVPKHKKFILGFEENRRYGALKLQVNKLDNTSDFVLTDFFFKKKRPTRFNAPRNAPLFVNIKNKISEDGEDQGYVPITDNEEFENQINSTYWAGLYEDSICDGCIAVIIKEPNITKKSLSSDFLQHPLPAFSLVTAPDFFQYVDSGDILKFDNNSGKYDSNFLQGGVERLSTSRKRPNPNLTLPTEKSENGEIAFPNVYEKDIRRENNEQCPKIQSCVYDTVTAVVSQPRNGFITDNKNPLIITKTSFLPDTASFVFAPGWDVTYAGGGTGEENGIFLSTHGLGSPFVEDTKLCAAANGMWAAASPDASRTFYGSLKPIPTGLFSKRRPPTSIPLLDHEIGFHKESTAIKDKIVKKDETFGWDGEQGPFITIENNEFFVNFTDIEKSNYVENVKDGKFDMSLLRNLTSDQIIIRMDCLKQSIKKIESSIVAYSKLWLVSAEKIDHWQNGAKGIGIPNNLFGSSKDWAITPQPQINGYGFLFVFVKINNKKPIDYKGADPKRMLQQCKKVYICQVSENHVTFCAMDKKTKNLNWK